MVKFNSKSFLLFISLIVLCNLLHSQSTSTQRWVKGVLQADESGETLPYATLSFYQESDSSLVDNTLTDDHGVFVIALRPESYYAVLQYIGFEDREVSGINVVPGRDTLDLGSLLMIQSAIALDEVEVTAERSTMELKLDRRVFHVGKDLSTTGSSAADILDNVPSVTVDPEGNVNLRGSQGVRILVDGKPSGMLTAGDTRALLRMQGDIIESIEVITNPSARYEAEGEAGIINLILKKNSEKGVNGSFSGTVGYPTNLGAAYNLNFRRKDFNLFSNFGIDYRKSPGGGESSQTFFENGMQTAAYTTTTDQTRGGLDVYAQVGTDWNIDEFNTLTGSLLYRTGKGDNNSTVTYRDYDENQNLINTTVRKIYEEEPEHNFEAQLLYRRTFPQKDRHWTIDFKYDLDDDTEIAHYDESSTNEPISLLQESSNTEDEVSVLFQTDYVHPLGPKSKVEGGLRAAFRDVNNDYYVSEQNADGEFVILPEFDNNLKYSEDIYAAYVIGAHEFGALAVQAGLRLELSDITAELLKTGDRSEQYYLNAFPSASMSYQFSEINQLQLSYSRRLSRPWFRNLLPFSNFNDPRANPVGNPNLRPEYTNAFEVGWLHYLTNGSLLSSVYYRRTTGVIERLILPQDDGTSIRYPVNLSVRDAYGIEFNLNYNITDNWDVNADMNFYREIVDGSYDETDYSNDTYTLGGRVTSQVDITDRLKVQGSVNYDAPRNTTQGKEYGAGSMDVAASLDIFQGKGTVILSGRDIFNTRQRRSVVDLPDYKAESNFQWRRRQQVVLSFNYRLNQEKKKQDILEDGEEG